MRTVSATLTHTGTAYSLPALITTLSDPPMSWLFTRSDTRMIGAHFTLHRKCHITHAHLFVIWREIRQKETAHSKFQLQDSFPLYDVNNYLIVFKHPLDCDICYCHLYIFTVKCSQSVQHFCHNTTNNIRCWVRETSARFNITPNTL